MPVMSLQGHTARREHKVSVGPKGISGSMVWWFRGGLNDQVWTEDERNYGLKTKKPLYRRHTTSTAIQLAVDHAFTGTYATRFRPSDPPESLRCPCGNDTRSPTHIILECPLFAEDRATSKILTPSHTLSLRNLLSEGKYTPRLLTFLETSLAAARAPIFTATETPDLELAEGVG